MTGYARSSIILAAALAALAGCAGDPLIDATPAGFRKDHALLGPYASPAESAPMVLKIAQSTAAHGNIASAASLYRRAHAMDPENFEAAAGLADMLSRLGAYEESAETWRAALRINPNDTRALRLLANTLTVMGHPDVAIEHYERGLAVQPEPRLYNGIGVAYDMQDQYRMAQAFYRVGLKIAPKDLSLRNNLGLSLLLSGQVEDSVAELKRAVGNPNATTRHRLNRALAMVLAGSSDSALSIARMDLDPRNARQQIAYFETIRALGNAPAAREAIQAHIRGVSDWQRNGATVRPLDGVSQAH